LRRRASGRSQQCRAFDHARNRKRHRNKDRETLADWAVICDDIICSSQAGALKSEAPQSFFGPWPTAHGVGFTDAVLIDDRADNCATFTAQGGTAIQWKMGTDNIADLAAQLRQWLKKAPRSRPAQHRRRVDLRAVRSLTSSCPLGTRVPPRSHAGRAVSLDAGG
jgi:hypothetical protein